MAPENTIAAFVRALGEGADGIEFDVRLARDDIPVVIHDASLKRTAGIDTLVAQVSSSELGNTDVGTWFNRKHPARARGEYAQEGVPTLAGLFELFQASAALFYLEMKSETDVARKLAAAVVNLIRHYSLAERVIVESFDLRAIEAVKLIDAGIKTLALFEPRISRPVPLLRRMKMIEIASRLGVDQIGLHHSLVSRRVIDKAKQSGLKVVVWTVDKPAWVARAPAMGLDALITNQPAALIERRSMLEGI